MKRLNLLSMFIFLLGMSLTFVSCSEDKNETSPIDPENLAGEYSSAIELDATQEYKLDGAMVILEGGSLTIPAGTKIVAKGGSTSYIAVAQGGKIYVNGTESKPVIMTSDKKEAGSWGGLVICGKAPVNTGDGGLSEVANLPYGGSVSDDNSGSLKYLRVEYTGYIYTGEKQFNGVSFFGVGSGTVVDYVVSYEGNDDGIEFFGGSVNASHLVSVNSKDDGIDFADGWSGTGSYWYALNSSKSGIEGSNNGTNGAATPMTDATLTNLTVYGMGEKPWFLKEGAGMQSIDNVVIGGLADGKDQAYFYTSSDDNDAAARVAAGDIVITNVAFVAMGDGNTKKFATGLTGTENIAATGAGNGLDMPSWFPAALNDLGDGTTVFPTELGGAVTLPAELGGITLTYAAELNAGTAYILDGNLIIEEGGSLTIPAGTIITAKGNTTSYIAVAQGGKIYVEGTADAPVVMTCDVHEPGKWGGVVICGKAPVNTGTGGLSEVGNLPYGGSVSDDNSGSIEYLRVEYTGYIYTGEKQFNGVSFFGVGSGTVVDYVMSYNGNDDGIEFFGGTVNASHLVSVGSKDDGIDFADGWSGTGEYWFSMNSAKSGIEGSNNGTNGAATPMTDATLKNLTVYGMGEKPWFLKEGAGKQNIDNVVIGGLAADKGQAYFYTSSDDADAAARITAGDIVITNVKFVDMGTGNDVKAVAGLSVTENENATGAGNGIAKPDWVSDAFNTLTDGTTKVIN